MRPSVPSLVGLASAVLLCLYAFHWAPEIAAPQVPESTFVYEPQLRPRSPDLPYFPPADGRVFLGVQTRSGVEDFTDEQTFAQATRTSPSVYEFSQGWAVDRFDPRKINRAAARGMLPMISWEPWDYRRESTQERRRSDQPDYRLSAVLGGEYDDYISSWATGMASLGYPIALRLAHEMNGYWYPWSEQANGNRPGDYVRMWRHVHDIFTAAGATNVIWVWSPNVDYSETSSLAALYPGDDYVDWLGVSGYYGTGGQREYRSFDSIFGPTLDTLLRLSRRPVVITETGATDVIGRRADWIRDMFAAVARRPEIIGVIWFESAREIDWRIGDSPTSATAFGAAASSARFATRWSPYSRPLTVRENG